MATALRAALGVLLGAVVLAWWRGTGPPTRLSAVPAATAHLSGLLAGLAAILLIALMARVPLLEQRVGIARLVRWHALAGAGPSC
ncbi:hypothetical protein [Streptacidiphilus sp. PAMC 29251]